MKFVKESKKGSEKLLLNQIEEPKTRKEWIKLSRNIVDSVSTALDDFCFHDWVARGGDSLECFVSQSDLDLIELAEKLQRDYPHYFRGIDLSLIERMPESVYNLANRRIHSIIERRIKELGKEYPEAGTEEYFV